jgi:ribosomal protein S8
MCENTVLYTQGFIKKIYMMKEKGMQFPFTVELIMIMNSQFHWMEVPEH